MAAVGPEVIPSVAAIADRPLPQRELLPAPRRDGGAASCCVIGRPSPRCRARTRRSRRAAAGPVLGDDRPSAMARRRVTERSRDRVPARCGVPARHRPSLCATASTSRPWRAATRRLVPRARGGPRGPDRAVLLAHRHPEASARRGTDLRLRRRRVPVGRPWSSSAGVISRAPLTAEAKRLGLADRVRLVGYQTNVPDWLAAATVWLLPTERENFSVAVLEALAAGCTVLSTRARATTRSSSTVRTPWCSQSAM